MARKARFTVDVDGLERIKKRLGPRVLNKALERGIAEASEISQEKAEGFAPRDTGAIANSLTAEVRGLEAVIGSPLPQARFVEYGRKPGGKLPPPDALEGWASRHGFSARRGTTLFVLARSIAQRGKKGRFFMRRAGRATKRALPRIMKRVASDIERDFAKP